MRQFRFLAIIFLYCLPSVALSQNLNMEYISSLLWTGVNDVAVRDSLAFCAMANGLTIVNIANPATPTYVSKYYTQGYAQGIGYSGQYVYIADGTGGLQVIDIADIQHPALAASMATPDLPWILPYPEAMPISPITRPACRSWIFPILFCRVLLAAI